MIRTVIDKDCNNYLMVDLDKKEVIRGVQWANDKTGYYHKFKFNKNGEIVRKYCKITRSYETVIEEKKSNIIFIKTNGITNEERHPIKLQREKTFKINYHNWFNLTALELFNILKELFGKNNIKVTEIKNK